MSVQQSKELVFWESKRNFQERPFVGLYEEIGDNELGYLQLFDPKERCRFLQSKAVMVVSLLTVSVLGVEVFVGYV